MVGKAFYRKRPGCRICREETRPVVSADLAVTGERAPIREVDLPESAQITQVSAGAEIQHRH